MEGEEECAASNALNTPVPLSITLFQARTRPPWTATRQP
jgi:hypothetical protein